jgi:zinc ribbon protein
MPRDRRDDEPLEEWEDDEPYDDDLDDEGPELVDCPECGEPVFEDAQQCPYCGQYIVHSTSAFSSQQPWKTALFLAGVIAIIAMCIFAF